MVGDDMPLTPQESATRERVTGDFAAREDALLRARGDAGGAARARLAAFLELRGGRIAAQRNGIAAR